MKCIGLAIYRTIIEDIAKSENAEAVFFDNEIMGQQVGYAYLPKVREQDATHWRRRVLDMKIPWIFMEGDKCYCKYFGILLYYS